MLVYWLSWYVLPSRPEDGISPYVFPLAVRLAKGGKIALAPFFLALYFHLVECIQNLVKSMGRYTVLSYSNTSFLQLFLWGRFKGLERKPTTFEAVNMVTVEDEN